MVRNKLKHSFREDNIPNWDCPCCGSGSLSLVKDSFLKNYSTDIDTSHEAFDPEWIDYVYSMMLVCANASCKAHIACSGTGGVEQEYLHDGSWGWFEYFQPQYFEPALKLFPVPVDTPEVVSDELEQSFSVFFKYPSMSLFSLRKALEVLLSELGVKSENDKGGFSSLADRIKGLPDKYKHIIEPMTAIRWLGNDGVHGDKASADDVLDGYEIFKHVLDELYPVEKAPVKGIVDRINSAKGIGK